MNTRLKNVETLKRESYNLKYGENGITLIALIVTIIVLLILAMVSVNLILRENLIDKAKYAKNEYEKGATNETESLNVFEEKIDNIISIIKGNKDTEYAENSNLRLNTKYYMSGKSTDYHIFYSDGYVEVNHNDGLSGRAKYIVNDGIVKYKVIDLMNEEEINDLDQDELEFMQNFYYEYTIIKEETNDLLLGFNMLYGTSENGLTYFSGEKYVNGENYIILKENETETYKIKEAGSAEGTKSNIIPVFYNGTIYVGEENIITSTDNLKTLIWQGETYTKSIE